MILIVQLCYARIADRAATRGALDGVVLVIVGFNVIILARLFLGNGADLQMLAIVVVSAALAISRRVSSVVILAAAALVGLLFG